MTKESHLREGRKDVKTDNNSVFNCFTLKFSIVDTSLFDYGHVLCCNYEFITKTCLFKYTENFNTKKINK